MQTFYNNPTISNSLLRDSLRDAGNKELRVVLNTIPLEQINNIWGTFHETPYKLSISYLVSPVLIPSGRTLKAPRVVLKDSTFEQAGFAKMTENNSSFLQDPDVFSTSLLIAVSLVDDYTGNKLKDSIKIKLEGVEENPIQNKSGYWLFLQKNNNTSIDGKTIKIKSESYFDLITKIPKFDNPKYPAFEIRLSPLPSYGFPSHATLVRGMITDINKNPISNAIITVLENKKQFLSTNKERICCILYKQRYDIFNTSGKLYQ